MGQEGKMRILTFAALPVILAVTLGKDRAPTWEGLGAVPPKMLENHSQLVSSLKNGHIGLQHELPKTSEG